MWKQTVWPARLECLSVYSDQKRVVMPCEATPHTIRSFFAWQLYHCDIYFNVFVSHYETFSIQILMIIFNGGNFIECNSNNWQFCVIERNSYVASAIHAAQNGTSKNSIVREMRCRKGDLGTGTWRASWRIRKKTLRITRIEPEQIGNVRLDCILTYGKEIGLPNHLLQ